MQKKEKKEKPVPICCVCGCMGVTVKCRSKKMVSCADPMNCVGNFRTAWYSSEESAIVEWNTMIRRYRA